MRRISFFAVVPVAIPRSGTSSSKSRAPREGYEMACSEFCRSGHRQMKAALMSVAATPTAGS